MVANEILLTGNKTLQWSSFFFLRIQSRSHQTIGFFSVFMLTSVANGSKLPLRIFVPTADHDCNDYFCLKDTIYSIFSLLFAWLPLTLNLETLLYGIRLQNESSIWHGWNWYMYPVGQKKVNWDLTGQVQASSCQNRNKYTKIFYTAGCPRNFQSEVCLSNHFLIKASCLRGRCKRASHR